MSSDSFLSVIVELVLCCVRAWITVVGSLHTVSRRVATCADENRREARFVIALTVRRPIRVHYWLSTEW